jgi:hypothetical protein
MPWAGEYGDPSDGANATAHRLAWMIHASAGNDAA